MPTFIVANSTFEVARTRNSHILFCAVETVEKLKNSGWKDLDITGFSMAHLEKMLTDLKTSEDVGKNMRYLGWLQAAAVVMSEGKISLDDCREINRGQFQ